MKTKLTLLLITMLISTNAHAFALMDYRLDLVKGQTREQNIMNKFDHNVTVKISFEPEKFKPVPAGAADCSEAIRVFPKIFTLEPGEIQTIKYISRSTGYCRVFYALDETNPETISPQKGVVLTVQKRIGIQVTVRNENDPAPKEDAGPAPKDQPKKQIEATTSAIESTIFASIPNSCESANPFNKQKGNVCAEN